MSHFDYKNTNRLEVIEWQNIYNDSSNQVTLEAIWISDYKKLFRKNIAGNKDNHFIIMIRLIKCK